MQVLYSIYCLIVIVPGMYMTTYRIDKREGLSRDRIIIDIAYQWIIPFISGMVFVYYLKSTGKL